MFAGSFFTTRIRQVGKEVDGRETTQTYCVPLLFYHVLLMNFLSGKQLIFPDIPFISATIFVNFLSAALVFRKIALA